MEPKTIKFNRGPWHGVSFVQEPPYQPSPDMVVVYCVAKDISKRDGKLKFRARPRRVVYVLRAYDPETLTYLYEPRKNGLDRGMAAFKLPE